MKYLLLLTMPWMAACSNGTGNGEVMKVLNYQVDCWNKGDIDCFMEGYWKSDSLLFIGSSGITYGWQATADRYRKRFGSPGAMGKLRFEILAINTIGPGSVFVLGKYNLSREEEPSSGTFSLVFKKIDNRWVIVSDHTSTDG